MLEKQPQQEDHKEEVLEDLLHQLPEELAEKWRQKIESVTSLDDAILMIRNVLVARNNAKEKMFTKIQDIKDPEIQEEVRGVIGIIESTLGNEDHFIGSGSIARVYTTPYAPHVCVKYIVDQNMLERHGNTMRQEVDYLVDLDTFCVEGIRIPRVYFQHMSENVTCFGMETVDGMSLDKIIENPHDCSFLELLQKQDMAEVLRKMKVFLTKLQEEKKIVHRDLATRNIMVDKNGTWYVIDFGKAKKIEIGDDSTVMSEQADFAMAESSIRQLFAKIY